MRLALRAGCARISGEPKSFDASESAGESSGAIPQRSASDRSADRSTAVIVLAIHATSKMFRRNGESTGSDIAWIA